MIRQADREAGVTIVIVALLMVTMLVTAALVVGHGNTRQTRREAQNIVDAAALAAAAELDGDIDGSLGGNGEDDHAAAEARALQYLDQNGLGGRGDISIDFDWRNHSECISVEVQDIDARVWFGEVVGRDSLPIRAEAYGCRGTYIEGDTPSIAMGPNIAGAHTAGVCEDKPGFDTSGAGNRFDGYVYANSSPKNGNASNRFGPDTIAEYRTQPGNPPKHEGPDLWLRATNLGATSGEAWPPGFNPTTELPISYFHNSGTTNIRARAYGLGLTGDGVTPFYRATTTTNWSGTHPAGVYYITSTGNDITINSSFQVESRQGWLRIDPNSGLPSSTGEPKIVEGDGVTFVLNGKWLTIKEGVDLEAFNWELNRLVVYSNFDDGKTGKDRCDLPVIAFDDCVHVDGVVFTPRAASGIEGGDGTGHDWNPDYPAEDCGHSHPDYSGGFVGLGFKANGNGGLYRSGPGTITSQPGGPGDAGRIYLGG